MGQPPSADPADGPDSRGHEGPVGALGLRAALRNSMWEHGSPHQCRRAQAASLSPPSMGQGVPLPIGYAHCPSEEAMCRRLLRSPEGLDWQEDPAPRGLSR